MADEQQVRAFADTDNRGTVRMIRAVVPLPRDGARFVVVASSTGTLANLDPRLHPVVDTAAAWPWRAG